jgi:hypothetical protein
MTRAKKAIDEPPVEDSTGIEIVPIGSVYIDPANVRRHGERNLAAIAASLARFGQVKPIVVDAKGVVRAGNGTLEAARGLGWAEIKVIRTELAGSEATAYAIADNRTAELAGWDQPGLAETLKALEGEGIDLAALGFMGEDIDALFGVTGGAGTGDSGSGETPDPAEARKSLADRFGVPPFSVLDARQGYWQVRKRAWLSLGIQSELGRGGGTPEPVGGGGGLPGEPGRVREVTANATVTGRPFPTAKVTKDADGKWTRGDGRGKPLNGQT